jgi:nucleotide-binding universal stress UspA family protein
MSFKEILLHVDNARNHEMRIDLAVALTRRHEAHLVGLAGYEPMPVLGLSTASTGSYLDVQTMDMLQQQERDRALEGASDEGERFRATAERAGISYEWRIVEGELAHLVTHHARYADLVILGQSAPDEPAPGSAGHLGESVLLGAGRPVLMVPYAGRFEQVGERVLVMWNATREASRALHDAMPLLRTASEVKVLTVVEAGDEGDGSQSPAIDITHHLARHGVAATATTTVAEDIDIGDLILSRAADFGSDLIVMGGYGHSPLREWALGGATRSLLQHMTVPVLLSH